MTFDYMLAIPLVGVALSVLIQLIKGKFGDSSTATKIVTISLAVILGSIYVLLRDTVMLATIAEILTVASTAYAFFFNKTSLLQSGKGTDEV